MTVPLLDLKAQYALLRNELDQALLRVAASQYFILGPEVAALERSMEEYLGVKHALGVSSGTDALLLALMALGIAGGKDGNGADEVIVPVFSFFATAGVVSRLGARPVFVDVDPVSFNIDPDAVERAITSRTRAIVPVHLYGQSADMVRLRDIAERHSIAVVEDAAQAIGARSGDGRCLGSIGTVGCFSFFPSKNLGAFGDAGLVTTNDSQLYERMRIMRVHGGEQRYYHRVIGGNFRLDDIQAAVLNVKLPYLAGWSQARRNNAALYRQYFMDAALVRNPHATEFSEHDRLLLPHEVLDGNSIKDHHIFNQYVVRLQGRDRVRERLAGAGIGNEVYYPVPFHQQECFADLGYKEGDFPVAERLSREVLALPIYPELSEEQIRYVVDTIGAE